MIAVEYAQGQNWGLVNSWGSAVLCSSSGCPTRDISVASPHDANLYVFITGQNSQDGLGLAWKGTVCRSSRILRNSINKYNANDENTAEVVAHEIAHNLGIDHDCINSNCAYWDPSYVGPKQVDGVDCSGYMDYR